MRALSIMAAVAALAACGAAAGSGTPKTALTITYWPQGTSGPKLTWTLRCSPARGTHPKRAAACRRLAQVANPFAPVPKDALCTQVYGGPDVALVRGTFRGRRVWARFRLRDGCEISRWNKLVPLLPAPGSA